MNKNLIVNIFLILLIFCVSSYSKELKQSIHKPNIILIVADDLGWNDVGFHGSEIHTPNIDSLAKNGIILNRFYVKSFCTPTRAALMTGRHPFKYGMSDDIVYTWTKHCLPKNESTIAEILKKAGYYNAIVGKWHLGHYHKYCLPEQRGFDYHYGLYCGRIDYFTHKTLQGTLDWHRNEEPVYEKGYSTELLGKESVKLVEKHDFNKAPLFMYLAFNAPHSPLEAKKFDIGKYKFIKDKKRRIFAAQVTSMDREIGNLIDALKSKGQYENTVILFTSDNGGDTYKWSRSDNRPLRGSKATLYEGGVRVPTIISFPKSLDGGKISELFFSIVDVFPTFAKIAEVDISNLNPDGIDIIQTLKNGNINRDVLVIHYLRKSKLAIIKNNYKFIINGVGGVQPRYYDTIELFNIKEDPYETHNLVNKKTDVVNDFYKIIDKYNKQAVGSILNISDYHKKRKNYLAPEIMSPGNIQSIENHRYYYFLKDHIINLIKNPIKYTKIIYVFLSGFILCYLFMKFINYRKNR